MSAHGARKVGPSGLVAFVRSRGYEASPILNTIAASEGAPLAVIGYDLRGPRGSKLFLPMDWAGLLSLDAAALWADGVDYATARLAERKAGRDSLPGAG